MIGGAPEAGYAAVGFLLDMHEGATVFCGATLVAPDVAVTAAHCVDPMAGADRYVMGFGTVANEPPRPENVRRAITEVIRHPSYAPVNLDAGSPFDIAVLRLAEPVTDREPANIGAATTSCDYRYVGYGRSTPGGVFVLHTEWGERKSVQTCVRSQTAQELVIRGVDGGHCWGDSGGPLMVEGQNEIVGLLSRFAPISPMEWYECKKQNTMIMIRVDVNRDFIAAHLPAAR